LSCHPSLWLRKKHRVEFKDLKVNIFRFRNTVRIDGIRIDFGTVDLANSGIRAGISNGTRVGSESAVVPETNEKDSITARISHYPRLE
jgi:hypothetical protein